MDTSRGSKLFREAHALAVEAGLDVTAEALTDQTFRLYVQESVTGGQWVNLIQQNQVGRPRPRHYAGSALQVGAEGRNIPVGAVLDTIRAMAERKSTK